MSDNTEKPANGGAWLPDDRANDLPLLPFLSPFARITMVRSPPDEARMVPSKRMDFCATSRRS